MLAGSLLVISPVLASRPRKNDGELVVEGEQPGNTNLVGSRPETAEAVALGVVCGFMCFWWWGSYTTNTFKVVEEYPRCERISGNQGLCVSGNETKRTICLVGDGKGVIMEHVPDEACEVIGVVAQRDEPRHTAPFDVRGTHHMSSTFWGDQYRRHASRRLHLAIVQAEPVATHQDIIAAQVGCDVFAVKRSVQFVWQHEVDDVGFGSGLT